MQVHIYLESVFAEDKFFSPDSVFRSVYPRGLKLKLLCGPHEDLQGNLRVAWWRWRNNSGTWA